jgi:hypothetical protein
VGFPSSRTASPPGGFRGRAGRGRRVCGGEGAVGEILRTTTVFDGRLIFALSALLLGFGQVLDRRRELVGGRLLGAGPSCFDDRVPRASVNLLQIADRTASSRQNERCEAEGQEAPRSRRRLRLRKRPVRPRGQVAHPAQSKRNVTDSFQTGQMPRTTSVRARHAARTTTRIRLPEPSATVGKRSAPSASRPSRDEPRISNLLPCAPPASAILSSQHSF